MFFYAPEQKQNRSPKKQGVKKLVKSIERQEVELQTLHKRKNESLPFKNKLSWG